MENLSRGPIIVLIIGFSSLFVFSPIFVTKVESALEPKVIINEIAWMGTKANSSDEWIELYNNTNQAISLEGWGLYEAGGETLIEPLTGGIEAKSYYLIERTDDTTVSDIPASQEPSSWESYGLKNSGEHLQLLNQNSTIIDEVNCSGGWFAGEAGPDYKTMERKNAQGLGSDPNNWATNNGTIINGKDTEGNSINGTPKAENSVSVATEPPTQSEPQPEPEPETEPETQPTEDQQQEEPQPEPQPITYPSDILINEIIPSPEGADNLEEWIELKNINNEEVNLSQWKIQDTTGSVTTYTFPEGTKIGPKGFLVLSRLTTKITLNNSGDRVSLLQPNGNIIDSITYGKAPLGQSYNLFSSGWFWSTVLTPGSENVLPPSEKTELDKNKINESASMLSTKAQDSQIQKELAAMAQQISEKPSLSVLLPALIVAAVSGTIALILKRNLKKVDFRRDLE